MNRYLTEFTGTFFLVFATGIFKVQHAVAPKGA